MRRAARLPGLALTCALALAAAGCAAGRPFITGAAEHGLYRRARAAPTLEDRLTASQQYLARYPDGTYATEVRAFFDRAEPLYFTQSRASLTALEAYLQALPRGPHAAEATLRLRDLRALDKAERTDLQGAADAAIENVAREAERRKAVGFWLAQWIGLFLDPAVFRAPMADTKASLIVPWSLALPWPFCERTDAGPDAPKGPPGAARRCAKLLQLDYRAMDDGEPQERQALVELAIWQDESGRPIEVTVGGPDLFLRLDETTTGRGASATDPEARLRGAERAVDLARTTFTEQLGRDAACKKNADTDVLRLACKGIELRVVASSVEGEDDRFVVRAAP